MALATDTQVGCKSRSFFMLAVLLLKAVHNATEV
jgi:hypothetical protein